MLFHALPQIFGSCQICLPIFKKRFPIWAMSGNSPVIVEINLSLLAAAVLCLMPVILVIVKIWQDRNKRRATRQSPFKALRRRPAGESLRIKIAEFDEQINDRIFLLIAMPIALAVMMFVLKSLNFYGAITSVAISLIWTLAFKRKLIDLLEQRRNYQLGFDGERFVGEELSRLIAIGFEIYHDVPFDGFNMDHVLVGKSGVFVVESKTKSKPLDESGNKEFHVVFDGKKLHWPWGADSHDIEQARNNAETLSKWLTDAVGENVEVSAILTLPGWWVTRKAPHDGVNILNPEEIIHAFDSKKVKLNDDRIRQICHQLNEKCRIEIN
jgi:hypothetical protein